MSTRKISHQGCGRRRARPGPSLRGLGRTVGGLIAQALMIAFAMIVLDELGGGNAKKLKKLPKGCRLGGNAYAFIGGFRIWKNAWKGRSSGRGRSRRAE